MVAWRLCGLLGRSHIHPLITLTRSEGISRHPHRDVQRSYAGVRRLPSSSRKSLPRVSRPEIKINSNDNPAGNATAAARPRMPTG